MVVMALCRANTDIEWYNQHLISDLSDIEAQQFTCHTCPLLLPLDNGGILRNTCGLSPLPQCFTEGFVITDNRGAGLVGTFDFCDLQSRG